MPDELKPIDEPTSIQALLADINIEQLDKNQEAVSTIVRGAWLPTLQLFTDRSKIVTSGKFPANHYGLKRGSNYEDLGDSVDVLPIAVRMKALDLTEGCLSFYDPKIDPDTRQPTGEFGRVVQMSNEAKGDEKMGWMWGPEILVWLPVQSTFALLFMGSPTARNTSSVIIEKIRTPITLTVGVVETKKYTYKAIAVQKCTSPFASLPSAKQLSTELEKFNNPPESEVEVAEDETVSTRER